MDFEQARFNMVEQQIRTWEVLNQDVLDLLFKVKREDYVPVAYRELAFADMEIPLGHGEFMWAPKLEARVLQALEITPADRVLEVGTGSGYMTALLAHMAKHVFSVEIIPEFKTKAELRLAGHAIANASLEVGDAARGWPRHGPYDVIVLTGSVPVMPEAFRQSLKPDGRLFAVVGDAPIMRAQLLRRHGEDGFHAEDLFETYVKPLRNAVEPERFAF